MPPLSKRFSQSLVGLSAAAVLAVYAAGFIRTEPVAARYAAATERRARALPLPTAVVREKVHHRAAATPKAAAPAPDSLTPLETTSIDPAALTELPVAAAPTPAPTPAPAPMPAAVDATPAEPVAPPASKLHDGTYLGWGSSRHGDIQASVVISGGRIVSATIAQCLTRYSCSWIDALPPQVVSRQSANVDYVSGATQSSDAFYGAVAQALAQALGPGK